MTAVPSIDIQYSVLPQTGAAVDIASLYVLFALAVGALLLFGRLVMRRRSVRTE